MLGIETLLYHPETVSDEALIAFATAEAKGIDCTEPYKTLLMTLSERLAMARSREDAGVEPGNTEHQNDWLPLDPPKTADNPLGCYSIENPLEDHPVCGLHGGYWVEGECMTWRVLKEVAEHRQFQFENYGPNRDLEDGTGPEVMWLKPVVDEAARQAAASNRRPVVRAREIEGLFRAEWDFDVDPNQKYTWMQMVREEVAEVFAMGDQRFLPSELVQVSALCASWMEKIYERALGTKDGETDA